MTDPMNALVQLQDALNQGFDDLRPCTLHTDLKLILDYPNGKTRFTYVDMNKKNVQAISMFVAVEPIDGKPCFQLGYAVVESSRRSGKGTAIVKKGLDELQHGLRRIGIPMFYVEAVVSESNEPSNKIAKGLISDKPKQITDGVSGQPAMHYTKLVE